MGIISATSSTASARANLHQWLLLINLVLLLILLFSGRSWRLSGMSWLEGVR